MDDDIDHALAELVRLTEKTQPRSVSFASPLADTVAPGPHRGLNRVLTLQVREASGLLRVQTLGRMPLNQFRLLQCKLGALQDFCCALN